MWSCYRMVKIVTSAEEFKTACNDKCALIDYTAKWCGPCQRIAPFLEVLENKYDELTVYKVDVDELSNIAQEQGISAMPTFHIFKNGKLVDQFTGANQSALEQMVDLVIIKMRAVEDSTKTE